MTSNWPAHVMGLELKKALTYRGDFWVQFFLSVAVELIVAYCLWLAVYETRGAAVIAGYSFKDMIYYYGFVTLTSRIVRGSERGYLADDIYTGGLTKYLLYPLPYLAYKYVTHLSQQLIGFVQLGMGVCGLWLIMGTPDNVHLSLTSFASGALACLLAGYLVYLMVAIIDLVAFWQDIIWNLSVMLRFAMSFLGGGLLPLTLFPEWGQQLVKFTPFPAVLAFPARTFMGQVGLHEWLQNAATILAWSIGLSAVVAYIWRRGLYRYSGVGI